jgi:hypothetical protein
MAKRQRRNEVLDQLDGDRHLPLLPALGVETQLRLGGHTHRLQLKADFGPEQVHDLQFAQTRQQESREEYLLLS